MTEQISLPGATELHLRCGSCNAIESLDGHVDRHAFGFGDFVGWLDAFLSRHRHAPSEGPEPARPPVTMRPAQPLDLDLFEAIEPTRGFHQQP